MNLNSFWRSSAGRATKLGMGLGALLGAVYLVEGIFASTNSTSVIGFAFLPLFAGVGAALGGVFAGSVAIAATRRYGIALRMGCVAIAAFLPFNLGSFIHKKIIHRHDLAAAPTMDAQTIDAYITNGEFRDDWQILYAFAHSNNTRVETLVRLADLGNNAVTGEVLSNPRAPGSLLSRYLNTDDMYLSYGLARNPNTPTATLARLAQSKDPLTSSMAQGRLNERQK